MFTHSTLLWFLPLALAPIVLHLLTRWRVKTVELSTFRFLMDGYMQERRRARLIELLVLLLRTAFVVLIILTLSRPVVSTFGGLFGGAAGRDVAIIIDTSASMGLRTGGQSALQRAQAAAGTLIDLLRPEDHVTLIDAGGKPRIVYRGFAVSPRSLRQAIESLAVGPLRCDLPAAIEEAVAGRAHGPRVLYLIGDTQRDTWRPLKDHSVIKRLGAETPVAVLDVGPTEPVTNLAVVGDAPLGARPVVGLPVLLRVTVTSSAAFPAKDPRVSDTMLGVLLDDRLVDQFTLSVPPGERVTRMISVTPARAGLIKGRFALPADALVEDDTFLFCLNVQEKLSVLVVSGPPGAKAIDRPLVYLDAALTKAPRELASITGIDKKLAEALVVTPVEHDVLTDAHLAAADVVILADAPIDATRAVMLRRYLDHGGGLLVLPGARIMPTIYNTHLLPGIAQTPGAAEEPGAGAASLAYAPPVGDPDNEATFKSIGGVRVGHPILSAFAGGAEPDSRADFFDSIRLYRFHPIQVPPRGAGPVAPSPPVTTLLSFTDGSPAMIEASVGKGRLILAAFPATPDWSNLPVTGKVFVPLLLRMVEYLRRPAPVEATHVVAPGQRAQVRVSDHWPDARVQATDAAGRRHTIELHRSDRDRIGVLTDTGRKGYYTFDITPQLPGVPGVPGVPGLPGAGAPPQVQLGFAVNVDEGESDVTMLDEPQLRELLGDVDVTYLRGSADDPQLAEQITRSREVWRTLIWLVFAVIAVEFLLATLRPKRSPPSLEPPSK